MTSLYYLRTVMGRLISLTFFAVWPNPHTASDAAIPDESSENAINLHSHRPMARGGEGRGGGYNLSDTCLLVTFCCEGSQAPSHLCFQTHTSPMTPLSQWVSIITCTQPYDLQRMTAWRFQQTFLIDPPRIMNLHMTAKFITRLCHSCLHLVFHVSRWR